MKEFLRVMKAVSDPSRVKILKMLQSRVMCVCEVHTALGTAQSTASKHLKILEDAGLISSFRDGTWVNYKLADGGQSPYAANLLGNIKRTGKGKLNVMYCLHACLMDAWRNGDIPAVPPFPAKKRYQIEEKPIEWLDEKKQLNVLAAIPQPHQCIFIWLKYLMRRPAEAMALHVEDFKDNVFRVHRSFSNRTLINRTKTSQIHHIPCPDILKRE